MKAILKVIAIRFLGRCSSPHQGTESLGSRTWGLLLVFMVCLAASGCASAKNPSNSFVGDLPGGGAVTNIAADAAEYLVSLYPPGHTSLFLQLPSKGSDAFSVAFDSQLRLKGFTVLATDSPNSVDAIRLAFVLDMIRQEQGEMPAWYLQLRLSVGENNTSFARAYNSTGMPEASLSSSPLDFRAGNRLERAYNNVSGTIKGLGD